VPNGHITGTVIDLNTGAPAAGVAVNVGGMIVQTDANGNYDRWLPIGTYTVTLALADGQGAPAQDTMMVPVEADAATVQHLNFRGQAPAAAPTAVAVAPAAEAPAAAAVPAAEAPAAEVPATEAPAAQAPQRLPRTSSEGYSAWTWLAFGMVLLLAGGLVGFGPVMAGRSPAMVLRAHAANSALLRALLAAPVRSSRAAPPSVLFVGCKMWGGGGLGGAQMAPPKPHPLTVTAKAELCG
jgi:hypothetical protein